MRSVLSRFTSLGSRRRTKYRSSASATSESVSGVSACRTIAGVIAISSRCSQRYIRDSVVGKLALGMAQRVLVEAARNGDVPTQRVSHELLVEALDGRQNG